MSEDADSYRVDKLDNRTLRRIPPSKNSVISDFGTVDSAINDKEPYSIRTQTSPVSPVADHSGSGKHSQAGGSVKSAGTVKLDLNCHETDSAVVTSSSDIVVGEKNEVHSNSGMTCDDKLGCLESGNFLSTL